MTTWDPQQYAQFWDQRRRPALDLIARLAPTRRRRGGSWTSAAARARSPRCWPTGGRTPRSSAVDSSPTMLADARALLPDVTWVEGDLTTYQPDEAPDLLFTNAALHWVPDHGTLIPRLFGLLAPGGTLAIQVPDKWDQPSHTIGFEIAGPGPVAGGARRRHRPPPAARPRSGTSTSCCRWRPTSTSGPPPTTTCWRGPDPVVEWFLGSFLRAFLSRLAEAEGGEFVAQYAEAMREAYPARPDGRTVMPFQRLFIVATANP